MRFCRSWRPSPPINPRRSDTPLSGTTEGNPLPFAPYNTLNRNGPLMQPFRVICPETSEVMGEFPNLAYADVFAEALDHQMCQPAQVEQWDGRHWIAL